MRVAEICSNCATYTNAVCIIYNGDYLSSIVASPLDSLDVILGNINTTFTALSGAAVPTSIPLFVGQLYIDTTGPNLWVGLDDETGGWGLVGTISTTTTTSSTSSTTTTTTTSA